SQFILWGNIYDIYPIDINNNIITLKLTDYLKTLLKNNGYDMILSYEPLEGFNLLAGEPDKFKEITGEKIKDNNLPASVIRCTEITEKLITNNINYSAVILNFSSRLPELSGNDINEFHYKFFRFCHTATPKMMGPAKSPKFN